MDFGFTKIGTLFFECPVCRKRMALGYPSMKIDANVYVEDPKNPESFILVKDNDIQNSPDFQFDPEGYNYLRAQCKRHGEPVLMVPVFKENRCKASQPVIETINIKATEGDEDK